MKNMNISKLIVMTNFFAAMCCCTSSHAADVADEFVKCAQTASDKARLACYDKIRDGIIATYKSKQSQGSDAYQGIDLVDLKVDLKSLKGKKVLTKAYVQVMGEMAMLKSDPMDMAPIFADASNLPREDRKKLANGCQVVLCGGSFSGVVKSLPLGVGLVLDKVVWN
jgi:hypothetical protein